jgi:hypothetical protein
MPQVRWHARLRHLQQASKSTYIGPPTCKMDGTCLEFGAQAAAARSHRPGNTTVLHLVALVTQTQQRDNANQRPCRGTQSLARPAVSLSNGCPVLSFSRSRVAVVCVSGLMEQPGGFVTAHPHLSPRSQACPPRSVMIGLCFHGACRQCRTVTSWDGGEK